MSEVLNLDGQSPYMLKSLNQQRIIDYDERTHGDSRLIFVSMYDHIRASEDENPASFHHNRHEFQFLADLCTNRLVLFTLQRPGYQDKLRHLERASNDSLDR